MGCKERGRQVDGPLDHSTGKGWVKDHAYGKGWIKTDAGSWKWTGAQYYDAKWVKKAITRLVLVETLGGIAPPTKQFLHVFAKEAAGSKTDRTEYGAASVGGAQRPKIHQCGISRKNLTLNSSQCTFLSAVVAADWLQLNGSMET